jgi:hypothetical protein
MSSVHQLVAKFDAHVSFCDTFRCVVDERVTLMEKVYDKLKWTRYKNDFCLIFMFIILIKYLFLNSCGC